MPKALRHHTPKTKDFHIEADEQCLTVPIKPVVGSGPLAKVGVIGDAGLVAPWALALGFV